MKRSIGVNETIKRSGAGTKGKGDVLGMGEESGSGLVFQQYSLIVLNVIKPDMFKYKT
jgi:hypothetical protein